ncbi:RNA-guided endonuclease TnpB family protein [Halanaerocella petrolearia]
MLRTSKILIKDKKFKNFAIEKAYLTRHFENILLILLEQDYKQGIGDRKLIANPYVMRAVICDTKGGSYADKVSYIKDKYKNHQLMQDLINTGTKLKKDNLVMTIKKVKKDFNSFYSKRKNGDSQANPPKPKKLSKMSHYTLLIDNNKGLGLSYLKKGQDRLGITLDHDRGRQYIKINSNKVKQLVDGDIDNIQNISLHYSNGELYLLITYHHQVNKCCNKDKPHKIAGLDVGVNNLASIYIKDKDSPSLIVDGKKYKTYNANFNRFTAKLNNTIDTLKNKNNVNKDKIDYLKQYRSYLFEKRNNFFYDQFHKISKRILEYLDKHNVTELVISKNLSKLKNNGECKLLKKTKQNFIQIPFIKLLEYLEYKAKDFGIKVTIVDESYTSKSNCQTDDIHKVHNLLDKIKKLKEKLKETKGHQYYRIKSLINAYQEILKYYFFQGRRIKRGLYIDDINNLVYNSDLNGARNIIKLSPNYQKKNCNDLKKLCNPIKVENDYQFSKLLKDRWNYEIKKKVS